MSFLRSTLVEGVNNSMSILRTAITRIEAGGRSNRYLAAVLVVVASEFLAQSEAEDDQKIANYLKSTARRLMS